MDYISSKSVLAYKQSRYQQDHTSLQGIKQCQGQVSLNSISKQLFIIVESQWLHVEESLVCGVHLGNAALLY